MAKLLTVTVAQSRAALETHMRELSGQHQTTLEALSNGMRASVAMLVRQALSGPRQKFNASPRYLARRTGGTARSVSSSPRVKVESAPGGTTITGWVGGNVVVAAHEEGVDKVVDVRAHRRRRRTFAGQLAGPAALTLSGRIKKKYVGGSQIVAAHRRHMRLRARHMLADTVEENRTGVRLRMLRASVIAGRLGRVPTVTELSGPVSMADILRGS